MTLKDIFTKHKSDFDHIIDFYKSDIASIRTGRATPALAEDIIVDAYGQKMHIKELASLATPEPRTLVIQPWDKGTLEPISAAIRKSDIGLNPVVDGEIIRLSIPSLTEERRKDFIKMLKAKSEESKVKIRRLREEMWEKIQTMAQDGEIREDEKFRGREDLQKIVDEHNRKIEELEKKKEGELMT
ncbi:MAG: ribosome recycling factor [Patescibacteria group bacterium]